jgi:hypothetical protein
MASTTHEAETQELQVASTRYVVEVRLEDGEVLSADVGTDRDAARAQLASLQSAGPTDSFVFLGDDVVVRGRDIRYARLREDDGSEGGLMESIKSRLGGGYGVTTYDTERGARTARVRTNDGESRGFFDDPGIGYGRRPWSETKPFFLTSEFLVLAGIIAGIAIAMGTLDNFDANRGWLLITVIAAAYMVSRGLAKSGTRDPNPNR